MPVLLLVLLLAHLLPRHPVARTALRRSALLEINGRDICPVRCFNPPLCHSLALQHPVRLVPATPLLKLP
jgi:hypothetical protein